MEVIHLQIDTYLGHSTKSALISALADQGYLKPVLLAY